ncbi:MAG TPA: hypothetical protein VFT64_11110 [Rickettsiales bacterium]|nr:hypothetical protein [Rickettsiales bacterium]
MNIRLSTILWVVMLITGACGLYMVKYKVQAVRAEVLATERQLIEEKRNQHVLNAEWTYLTRPERLRTLAAKYLNMQPMRGQQIAEFSTLPYAAPEGSRTDVAKQEAPRSSGTIKFVSGGPADEGYHDE